MQFKKYEHFFSNVDLSSGNKKVLKTEITLIISEKELWVLYSDKDAPGFDIAPAPVYTDSNEESCKEVCLMRSDCVGIIFGRSGAYSNHCWM